MLLCQISQLFLFSFEAFHVTSTDACRWFVLVLFEANRGSRTKQCWAAQRTFNMSGYFSSPLWINTARPSITGCCLKAHLWKVLRQGLKGLWNIGTSLLKLRLNCLQIQFGQDLKFSHRGEESSKVKSSSSPPWPQDILLQISNIRPSKLAIANFNNTENHQVAYPGHNF